MAGLLACPVFEGLPIGQMPDSGKRFSKTFSGLTAAGTAPVFHRIPSFIIKRILLMINQ